MKANVERAEFNYETESFMSKEYTLPYIINEKGKKESRLKGISEIADPEEMEKTLKKDYHKFDLRMNKIMKKQVDCIITGIGGMRCPTKLKP